MNYTAISSVLLLVLFANGATQAKPTELADGSATLELPAGMQPLPRDGHPPLLQLIAARETDGALLVVGRLDFEEKPAPDKVVASSALQGFVDSLQKQYNARQLQGRHVVHLGNCIGLRSIYTYVVDGETLVESSTLIRAGNRMWAIRLGVPGADASALDELHESVAASWRLAEPNLSTEGWRVVALPAWQLEIPLPPDAKIQENPGDPEIPVSLEFGSRTLRGRPATGLFLMTEPVTRANRSVDAQREMALRLAERSLGEYQNVTIGTLREVQQKDRHTFYVHASGRRNGVLFNLIAKVELADGRLRYAAALAPMEILADTWVEVLTSVSSIRPLQPDGR